ncbi:MAG: hypothetical protein LDL41_05415, partial [Coleofasciculus sp. S288]|nr:hypothetical protein [Coleofasciculus sp. S288]
MTRNREFPDRWPGSKSSSPGQINGGQRKRNTSAAKHPSVRPASGMSDSRHPPSPQPLTEPEVP